MDQRSIPRTMSVMFFLPASHACFIDGIQRNPWLNLQGRGDNVRVSLDLENEEAYQPEAIQLEELQAEKAVLHSN